jgi:adenine/guanine/hypoxanthine permease
LAKAGIDADDVSTSTCLCCCIPTLIVGLLGNLPFVMAPGLGLSAYFTYGLVNRKDSTAMTWQAGLACVFIAGAAMLVLSLTLLVQRSMALVPGHIKLGTIIGIGFLLATIGFESSGIIRAGELADPWLYT